MTQLNLQNKEKLREAYQRICVVIPAYNAESTIEEVVMRTRKIDPQIKIIVVDDGSKDRTAELARKAHAEVISHDRNRGKGIALQTGFSKAIANGADAIITLDADLQHAPEEIPKFVQKWLDTDADLIIGTRKHEIGKMPPLRIFTNTVSSLLVSLSAGRTVKDSQSGYRLVSRRLIETIPTQCPGYGVESELVIKAAIRGYRIEAVPIATIYGDEKSYIHPVKQPLLFIGLILRSIIWRLEYIGGKKWKGSHTFDK